MPRPCPKQLCPRLTGSFRQGQSAAGEPAKPSPQDRSLLLHDRLESGPTQPLLSAEYSARTDVVPSRESMTPAAFAVARSVLAWVGSPLTWPQAMEKLP